MISNLDENALYVKWELFEIWYRPFEFETNVSC